jgi:hypothetical protein
VLFQEYLADYDFWGYCDLDVLFGNLEEFLTDEKLERFDKIYDVGHLSILRNTKEIREAFMGTETCAVPYKDIFNHKYNCVFDENYGKARRGINQVLRREGHSVYVNRAEMADIDIQYRNFHVHDYPQGGDYYFTYDGRDLWMRRWGDSSFKQSMAYAHFQQKKDLPVLCTPEREFAATPKGFVQIQALSKELFYEKKDRKTLWYIKFRFKRYIEHKVKARLWQMRHRDICRYRLDRGPDGPSGRNAEERVWRRKKAGE